MGRRSTEQQHNAQAIHPWFMTGQVRNRAICVENGIYFEESKMKYRICEMTLNEYVNHPTEVKIDEVEANSMEEARKVAAMRWPNREIKVIAENNSVDCN